MSYAAYYYANPNLQSKATTVNTPDPNVLHKFASYNTLFTLSALSLREIRNPRLFFQSKPHDIIARSGGIGGLANRFEGPPSEQGNRFS